MVGLRDSLVVHFGGQNLRHNPKLVGVTSCRRGAGVSGIAIGLAASLSETGDGNALLVDFCGEQGAAQQFRKGKSTVGLDTDLQNGIKNEFLEDDNHHAPAKDESADHFPSNFAKRFAKLMPQLKASDYDYIIFDMPPVSLTSITARLAGLMDIVLMVVESEDTFEDVITRKVGLLQESKTTVRLIVQSVS